MISNTKIAELPLKLKYKISNANYLNLTKDCMHDDRKNLEPEFITHLCTRNDFTKFHSTQESYHEKYKNTVNYLPEALNQHENGSERNHKRQKQDTSSLSADEIYIMLKHTNNDDEFTKTNMYLSNNNEIFYGYSTVGLYIRNCIRDTLYKESFNSQSLLPFSSNKIT
jgi:hypothetical protein